MKTEKSSDNLIIVADSSPLICSVLKMTLEEAGFVVTVASNGNEVLEKIVSDKPFCIILNHKLPVIDGSSVCRIVKEGMGLTSIFCIVFGIENQWNPTGLFSCVDVEIPASVKEIQDILIAVKNRVQENQNSVDAELGLLEEGFFEPKTSLPDLPLSAFVSKAMEKNLVNTYIMESLYSIGSYTTKLDVFSKKLINLVLEIFDADAAILIVNSNPIQLYCNGVHESTETAQKFVNVAIADFEEVDVERKYSSFEKHFLADSDFIEEINFSSYKSIPLFSESFLGSIHIASRKKQAFGPHLDSVFQFFTEKVNIFLAQAVYYKKASQTESRLRGVFSRFVPEEIIDELAEVGNSDIAADNDKRKVAVLISDIRSFTNISELNQPENVVSFLNGYFSRMVEVIKKHGGTIDKFMGDAIMALFGAPVSYEDNVARAVNAALEMKSLIPEISCENLIFPEGTDFNIGIGIHYGEVIAGSIGCKEKSDYTVIGDTVNLASRLEGLSKVYGVHIIISGAVKKELDKSYNLLHLDNVKVKGKSVGVEIYRVDDEQLPKKYVDCYTKAIQLYEAGAWNLAQGYFEKALVEIPNDKSATTMLNRCKEFIQSPPENWDGAYTLTRK